MPMISCLDTRGYDPDVMSDAVARHFAALGVAGDITPSTRVLIKPNLLSGHKPDRAVTTHPALVGAVVDWLRRHGAEHIVVADSPGGPYTPAVLRATYAACGYKGNDWDDLLNYDTGFVAKSAPEGSPSRTLNIINPVAEADFIISLPKLKTHGMTTLSCAVKNMFGAVPGLQKTEMHYRFPDIADFSGALVSIARTARPDVTLVDAIDCMEGDGPSNGTLRRLDLTIASRDPFALDVFAARLTGLPEDIPTISATRAAGLIDEAVSVTGEYTKPDRPFTLPASVRADTVTALPPFLSKPINAVARALLRPFPQVIKDKCIGCGKCAESCPARIIRIENRLAQIPRKGCITCLCCQEMCKSGAIRIVRRIKL